MYNPIYSLLPANHAYPGRIFPTAHRERSPRLQGFADTGGMTAPRIVLLVQRGRKRSGDEPDVCRALIGDQGGFDVAWRHRAIRVVPRLRSSLFFLREDMADGVFCIAENKFFYLEKGFDENNGMDRT